LRQTVLELLDNLSPEHIDDILGETPPRLSATSWSKLYRKKRKKPIAALLTCAGEPSHVLPPRAAVR
jgi:hypothetical protein